MDIARAPVVGQNPMQLSSRLRLLKYAFKSAVLARRPEAYWSARRLFKGHHEGEIMLVPHFANPARAAFDIGAHFGIWTDAMRGCFREVHAFEPVPRLARVLARGLAGKNVVVHPVACSNTHGKTTLRAPVAGLGRSTIEARNALVGMKDPSQPIDIFDVETVRLDDLGLPDPAFIKIDVEGHELAVLEGAERLLARARPALLLELVDHANPGYTTRVEGYLEARGYTRASFSFGRNVFYLPH